MRLTTLCYIEKDGKYLMLHRTKKKNDENHDKWIGVGGKFEPGESPDECLIREVKEETGLTLITYQFRGIVTFCSDEWEDEYMHLFTATEFERRSQSDCVHEQVAKADCECPLYDDTPLYKYTAYIRSGYRESKKVSRRLRKGINGDR